MAEEETDDELDALLDSYALQAAKDLNQVEAKSKKAASKQPKNMAAAREEGLSQPVSEQSKGFKLLSAMGYVAGTGLGASRSVRDDTCAVHPCTHSECVSAFVKRYRHLLEALGLCHALRACWAAWAWQIPCMSLD